MLLQVSGLGQSPTAFRRRGSLSINVLPLNAPATSLTNWLVLSSNIRIAVEATTHAVKIDSDFRRLMYPIRLSSDADRRCDPLAAIARRAKKVVKQSQYASFGLSVAFDGKCR